MQTTELAKSPSKTKVPEEPEKVSLVHFIKAKLLYENFVLQSLTIPLTNLFTNSLNHSLTNLHSFTHKPPT